MIDDVDYMKQHGEIETRIFYIDSNQRSDPKANPNDFTIQFDEPIRNVVGFSVKDSNVPSTSYTIDDHSNIFRLFCDGVRYRSYNIRYQLCVVTPKYSSTS
jgi:hypothetical protein